MPRTDKREQIMQATEKLFAGRRLHEITLDNIVREARVGKGTIYTYFRDKDDLFFHVAAHGFDELCELLSRRVADDAPFAEQLLQACGAIAAFFRRRRQLFRMIQAEDARMSLCSGSLQQRWFEKRRCMVLSLAEILHRGQRDKLLRTDLSPEQLADLLLGLLRARGRNIEGKGGSVSDPQLVDMFLNGAAAPKASVPRRRRPAVERRETP